MGQTRVAPLGTQFDLPWLPQLLFGTGAAGATTTATKQPSSRQEDMSRHKALRSAC